MFYIKKTVSDDDRKGCMIRMYDRKECMTRLPFACANETFVK